MYSETVRGRVERYADWLDPFELDATPPRADERETPRPATIR
jgi:hypothetical protein